MLGEAIQIQLLEDKKRFEDLKKKRELTTKGYYRKQIELRERRIREA